MYVHSDLQDSCVVIVKNPLEAGVLPPGTLAQAGVMAIATSRAWDAKQGSPALVLEFLTVVTSAWWVNYLQIQRREGGYDVRGKKNYLPPSMLVLGYGILWTTEDEETMERHARPLLEVEVTPGLGPEEVQGQSDNADDDGCDSDVKSDAMKSKDKYNLDQYGSPSDDENESQQPVNSQQASTKHYISVKQRRDLKKGKPVQDPDPSKASSVIVTTPLSRPKTTPNVRGKKSKMKKIQARYADQSDEERELARKLLGATSTTTEKQTQESTCPLIDKGVAPPPVQVPLQTPKPLVDKPLEKRSFSAGKSQFDLAQNLSGSRTGIPKKQIPESTRHSADKANEAPPDQRTDLLQPPNPIISGPLEVHSSNDLANRRTSISRRNVSSHRPNPQILSPVLLLCVHLGQLSRDTNIKSKLHQDR